MIRARLSDRSDVHSAGGVLVLAGPPCAGKSSVAKVLATSSSLTRGIYVEVDSIFSLLLPESDRNREDRMLAYDAAHVLARLLYENKRTPIIECTYARQQQRSSLRKAMADIQPVELWVVELYVSPEVAVQRFRQRHQPTDLSEQRVRKHAEAFPYSDQALRLESATASPKVLASQIETWIEGNPPPMEWEPWVELGRGWE